MWLGVGSLLSELEQALLYPRVVLDDQVFYWGNFIGTNGTSSRLWNF